MGGEIGTHSLIHNFQLNLLLRIPLEVCVVAIAGEVITTSSREISVVGVEWYIFPYHEIGILTGRLGGEGGKAMSSREDYLVQKSGLSYSS